MGANRWAAAFDAGVGHPPPTLADGAGRIGGRGVGGDADDGPTARRQHPGQDGPDQHERRHGVGGELGLELGDADLEDREHAARRRVDGVVDEQVDGHPTRPLTRSTAARRASWSCRSAMTSSDRHPTARASPPPSAPEAAGNGVSPAGVRVVPAFAPATFRPVTAATSPTRRGEGQGRWPGAIPRVAPVGSGPPDRHRGPATVKRAGSWARRFRRPVAAAPRRAGSEPFGKVAERLGPRSSQGRVVRRSVSSSIRCAGRRPLAFTDRSTARPFASSARHP